VVNKTFELLVLEQAVTKLFSGHCFDICQLDAIGKMLGRDPSQHPSYRFLRGLHCVHYADMAPELLAQLEGKVAECLSGIPFNPARLVQQITDEGRDFTFTEDRALDAPPGDQRRVFRIDGRK
jgi:hypothetical protein